MFFAGWVSGLLWVPQFGDKFGRWKTYWWGNVFRVILFTMILISNDYWLTTCILFLIGFSENSTLCIGFTYFTEMIGEPYRPLYGSLWTANEGLVYLWATLWFAVISTHWLPFILIGYVILILSTIATYWWPESPCWLVNRRLYDEAD